MILSIQNEADFLENFSFAHKVLHHADKLEENSTIRWFFRSIRQKSDNTYSIQFKSFEFPGYPDHYWLQIEVKLLDNQWQIVQTNRHVD